MKLIQISLLTLLAFACQGPQPTAEVSAKAQPGAAASSSSNESDSSEGVVGPDEAFFSGVYLESVFAASKANPKPQLEVSGINLKNEGQVEAFDFAANLKPKRLELMSRILLKLGDKDADQQLSYAEFSSLKLSADLKGDAASAISHAFDKEVFDAAAGEDGLLSASEIQELLSEVASESKLSKLSKQDGRKALVDDWEKVLKAYDADGDGKLSLDEQSKLRKDRALVLHRFTAE